MASPFAPDSLPHFPAIEGITLAVGETGAKYKNRADLLLMCFDVDTCVAGVFTKSKCASAPVDWCKANLENPARALIVNAGNANAFTGQIGGISTQNIAEFTAKAVGCQSNEVFMASTGVIGEPLDAEPINQLIENLIQSQSSQNWNLAASAIMTTDTYPKGATRSLELDGMIFHLNGITKGSGMIAPDMATMLGFIGTDVPMTKDMLQLALTESTQTSFNAITVDGDTSTSDTVLAFAPISHQSITPISSKDDPRFHAFKAVFRELCLDLAMQIVKDGEGISKLIQIDVQGAESDQSAKRIALSIANSPLVKTAIAGEDANWGRVVMAVGKAGESANRDTLSIWFGDIRVAHQGLRDPEYSEEKASQYMKSSEITITVDLELNTGQARVWTCDLTHEYISINADYRS